MSDTDALPSGLGAPATRALAAAGITTLTDVRAVGIDKVGDLHGVGPKAIRLLREALVDGHRAGPGLRSSGVRP